MYQCIQLQERQPLPVNQCEIAKIQAPLTLITSSVSWTEWRLSLLREKWGHGDAPQICNMLFPGLPESLKRKSPNSHKLYRLRRFKNLYFCTPNHVYFTDPKVDAISEQNGIQHSRLLGRISVKPNTQVEVWLQTVMAEMLSTIAEQTLSVQ